MTNFLLLASIIITIVSYLYIILLKSLSKKGKDKASQTVIELTKDDNSIHLVENKDSFINKYLIKRQIIKLTPSTYNSNSIFNISIAYLFSGYTKLDNKKINTIGKIIPYLYPISFTPIISCLISIISKTSMDAKISILLLILILIYQYIIYDQNIEAIEKLEVKEKDIIESLNKIILISKIFSIEDEYVYIRDKFGVPYKYYLKQNKK